MIMLFLIEQQMISHYMWGREQNYRGFMNIFLCLIGKKGWKSLFFFFAGKYIKTILKLVTNTTLRKKTEVAIGKHFYKCIIDSVIKSMKYVKKLLVYKHIYLFYF